MPKSKKLVSIIIPVYNEESNIEWHFTKIQDQIDSVRGYQFEVVYVNDGSTDNSLNIIRSLSSKYTHVHYVNFSRNFGKEAATTAGLQKCRGDAAVMIDSDGQHPIESLNNFLAEWERGFEVVIGVRKSNVGEGVIKKYGSKFFYGILNRLTDGQTIPGSTDYRLIDRKVIDEFNKLTERNRITRGLIDWLGFRRTTVDFSANARYGGKATYKFSKLVRLALHAFVSHTTTPLQLTGILGGVVTITSAVVGLFLLFEMYILRDPLALGITGGGFIALFLSLLIGIVLMCQWLLALYIESIHNETQNRPLFIIRDEDQS